MKALIWRETRALRNPGLIGLGLVLIWVVLVAWPIWNGNTSGRAWAVGHGLLGRWVLLMPLVGLLLGCFMIAQERGRGEVQFSRSWPASAGAVWAAKLIVGLSLLLAFVVLSGGALFLIVKSAADGVPGYPPSGAYAVRMLLPMAARVVAAALALFGIGLLMSTIRPSPFDAVGSTFIAALLLLVALGLLFLDFVPQRWGPETGFWPLSLPGSTGGFITLGSLICLACIVASYIGFTRTRPLQFGQRLWLGLGIGVALVIAAVVLTPVGLAVFGEPMAEDVVAIEWAGTDPEGAWVMMEDVTPEPLHDAEGDHDIRPDERHRLWIMRADGTDLRCIARWPVRVTADWEHPRWLPFTWGPEWDEQEVLRHRGWVWAWDMQRMEARKLPHPTHDSSGYLPLSVSPDGRYLVGDVIIRLDDLSAEPIATPKGEARFAGWGDGRAYFDLARETREALWAVKLPSGGLERIAEAPDTGQWGASVSPDEMWTAWSEYDGENSTLVLQEMATGREERFAGLNSIWHGWSPDGRYLWTHEPGTGLSVLEMGETIHRVRVDLPDDVRWPGGGMRWSPDGERVAVQLQEEADGNLRRRAVVVVDADGANVREVARTGRIAADMWRLSGWLSRGLVLMLEDHQSLVAIDAETGERAVVFGIQ